jgi:glycine hydroxymethyltransferase
MALLKPGDTFLGMALDQGGHLTHGSPANQSGKWFKVVSYGVKPDTHLIDYEQMESVARREKPKLIIAGASAYSRADRLGALPQGGGRDRRLLHGRHGALCRPGSRPASIPARCRTRMSCTTTTHKTLRGPRGGMILSTDRGLGKKINSAVFPGLQGGR